MVEPGGGIPSKVTPDIPHIVQVFRCFRAVRKFRCGGASGYHPAIFMKDKLCLTFDVTNRWTIAGLFGPGVNRSEAQEAPRESFRNFAPMLARILGQSTEGGTRAN